LEDFFFTEEKINLGFIFIRAFVHGHAHRGSSDVAVNAYQIDAFDAWWKAS
jgi:hypothetical protein